VDVFLGHIVEATTWTNSCHSAFAYRIPSYDWYGRKKWPNDHTNAKTRSCRYRSSRDKTNI